MTPLTWSVTTQRDTDRIAARLIDIDCIVARNTVVAIRVAGRRLQDFPYSAPAIGRSRFRKLIVAGVPYLIIYRVVAGQVEIVRVRQANEDWLPR